MKCSFGILKRNTSPALKSPEQTKSRLVHDKWDLKIADVSTIINSKCKSTMKNYLKK